MSVSGCESRCSLLTVGIPADKEVSTSVNEAVACSPIAPLVLPCRLRTPVNKKNDGPFLLIILAPSFRFQDPSLHILVQSTLEPELLTPVKGLSFQGIGGEASDLFDLALELQSRLTRMDLVLETLQVTNEINVIGRGQG